ncbi:MAG: VCBS repeat-containing protein, partial [Planctomycetales bacterium]|nr:VCBS repeat-containing protein [Planctomycetales bacterium]
MLQPRSRRTIIGDTVGDGMVAGVVTISATNLEIIVNVLLRTATALAMVFSFAGLTAADDLAIDTFERQALTDVYFSEGANVGDVDGDGAVDIVHGPYWFAGPKFETKHEIYPAEPQPRERYANNFFQWVYDFDGDGANDVLAVGLPGSPAVVYRNPGKQFRNKPWPAQPVLNDVGNEAPQWTNLVGDDRPELICVHEGHFGYATPNWEQPLEPWTFHRVSEQSNIGRFAHGLGAGDVDGDGRLDVLAKDGWYQQPEAAGSDAPWLFHAVPFAGAGGAEMYAYDVDGDGDNDVITSLAAHEYGLAWHEQTPQGFKQHLIMGDRGSQNRYGVAFSELHSVQLVDIDGDGLKDIVTGKTYWSHHKQSPMWDAGAVVYWFELHRNGDGTVDFIPHKADGEAGIGRGLTVMDINNDGLLDIITGGMKGGNVLVHSRRDVSHEEYEQAQPRKAVAMAEGLEPAAAAAHMTVPPGFKVQLAAGEPTVHQPVAMCFDAKGRVWIAEAHTYPLRAAEGQGKDKILILEDTDGDGTLDKSKVFIEGLNLVSGLEVGFGGVYVGAAPYLMFIPDVDGNDVPDGQQG